MSKLFDLTGKKAVVTGGTSGIGLAIVEALADAGAEVVASSENQRACAETAQSLTSLGRTVHGIVCDVSSRVALASLAQSASDRMGHIDILVCNAGVPGPAGPTGNVDEIEYQRVFDINLNSAFWLTGIVAPQMAARGGGSIILTSSLSSLRGTRQLGAYAMTKAAVTQLARNLAAEWGPGNVRANAIVPGLTRTPMIEQLLEKPGFLETRLTLTPLGRIGEPHEIAAAAVFLASRGGAYMTGQSMVIDGGNSISDGN